MDVVYRLFDTADRLLYVGISNQVGMRLTQHEKEKPWWDDVARITVVRCPDRNTALAVEAAAILTEDPIHNIKGRTEADRPRIVKTPAPRPERQPVPLAEQLWLNLDETSLHFGLHRTTVYRLIRKGEIPAHVMTRFGRSVRINRVELERHLAERDAA